MVVLRGASLGGAFSSTGTGAAVGATAGTGCLWMGFAVALLLLLLRGSFLAAPFHPNRPFLACGAGGALQLAPRGLGAPAACLDPNMPLMKLLLPGAALLAAALLLKGPAVCACVHSKIHISLISQ